MTVLLAYAGPTDLLGVAVLLLLVLPGLLWAMLRVPRRPDGLIRHELPPSPTEPRSHVRPLPGPARPYDWHRDEARHFTPADVARLFDLEPEALGLPLGYPPVRVVVDETPLLERR